MNLVSLLPFLINAVINGARTAPGIISASTAVAAGGVMIDRGPVTSADYVIMALGAIGVAVNFVQAELTRRRDGVPVEDRKVE